MKKIIQITVVSLLVLVSALPGRVIAVCPTDARSCSTSYRLDETFFGAGGELNACSTNFCSKQAAGELAVGNTASANFQAQGGFNTDRQPFIQFNVSNTDVDLGTLSPTAMQATNATFTIEAYLSHGYVVMNASPPPDNNGHQLTPLSTPTPSTPGTEQFGINLVANTSPPGFGSDPAYIPDSTFSSGSVEANYNTPDEYMYAYSGPDSVIASSNKSSSYTTYTISYIFNASHITPGGTYTFHHVLVATATF